MGKIEGVIDFKKAVYESIAREREGEDFWGTQPKAIVCSILFELEQTGIDVWEEFDFRHDVLDEIQKAITQLIREGKVRLMLFEDGDTFDVEFQAEEA